MPKPPKALIKALEKSTTPDDHRSVHSILNSLRSSTKFLNKVGKFDNVIQKSIFSLSERQAYSNIFGGTVGEVKAKFNEYTPRANLTRYNRKSFNEKPVLFEENKGKIPFPNLSKDSYIMNATYQSLKNCDVFAIVSHDKGYDKVFIKSLVKAKTKTCKDLGIDFFFIKPSLLQACIWNLETSNDKNNDTEELDKYWFDGHIDNYNSSLLNQIRYRNKQEKDELGYLSVYSFKLGNMIPQALDKALLESYGLDQKIIGARFSPNVVGGSKRLKDILSNIETPWKIKGDDQTKTMAELFKFFASNDLVKSSSANDGGIILLRQKAQ